MSQKSAVTIIGVVIVLILIAWGVSAMNNDADVTEVSTTSTPTTTASPSANASDLPASATPAASNLTVTYNGSTFSPANLTIKKGETVTFVNNGNGGMWVASDPHPIHTDFSAFDARKSYAAGTSYTFTFNQTGTFDYHDHNNSSATGTIVVQ